MSPLRPPTSCPRCQSAHRGGCPKIPRKKTEPFYSTHRWQNKRAAYRKRHPLCERCSTMMHPVLAGMVHHIVPIDDVSLRLRDDNLEALCHTCHNREHHAVVA